MCQFDELFDRVNSNNSHREYHVEFAFDVNSLNKESMTKIKHFFYNIIVDEKIELIRCIRTIKEFSHEYISDDSWSKTREIEIDNMYRLLKDIMNLKSKPRWYRKLLIFKQKLLGVETVDTITISVFQLATWDRPYYNNDHFNNEGLLYYLPGLQELLLALFAKIR